MHPLIEHIFPSATISSLGGGDINDIFKIVNDEGSFVVKINSKDLFPEMFIKEVKGLDLLNTSVNTPRSLKVGEYENWQYLQLEYIQSVDKTVSFWQLFGQQLADLHMVSNENFGLDHSNYIGCLVQSNKETRSWEDFLINERLSPMVEMAVNSGEVNFVEAKIMEKFYLRINEIWPVEKPSLLHGDLWSGNFIASNKGLMLIDPAIYFGHREMDIAMMHLFGGFDQSLFDSYNAHNPLEKGWEGRIAYNQIYPLLVHLNIFGRIYWKQLYNIVKDFG